MKKLLSILVLGLLLSSNFVFSENYKTGQEIEGQIVFSKKIKIDLPDGKWTLVSRTLWNWHGLNLTDYALVKVKDNELSEYMSIGEFQLGGIAIGQIDPIINEILFKDKYDGCYERPEYFLLKFYAKGSTHNCFKVRHIDVMKEINYPDDPLLKGANRVFNNWVNDNSIKVPKVALASGHTYFSRLVGGNWYQATHLINPKILNAPKNKFYTEESSEYHKYNIEQFPEHKKIMQKWISISAERHKKFEENVRAKNRHRLDLSNYYSGKIKSKDNKNKLSGEVITQIKQLNDLYKAGVLTKEEFEKAKKKILN
tara:strand:- start:106 stop:1041 length:936 start_codon:yes stop_codon:yes gene_type:complete